MSDIKINGIDAAQAMQKLKGPDSAASPDAFEAVMQEAMGKLSQVQGDAQKAVQDLTGGGDITQAILAMEQADMNFQLMVEVRNKLLSAYEEIMRMQV